MIRKKASSQKTKKGIKKTANYILKDKGCCLYEASFIHNPKTIKGDLAERLSKEIDDDVNYHNKNRTIGSTQQVRTYHDVVSFHTNDDMNPQKALLIAKELYEKTHNLSNRKYLMAVHNDTDEMHVHIIWSVRDNNGKTYKQKDDYRIIEIECDKLEDKHKLIKPQNRKATSPKKNDLEKLPSTNERMLDVRGITSNKKQMKDVLKPFLDNAKSPSDFINQISQNGFNIIHNGKSAFSIQHDDQTFKASELNLSYKTLKAKLGEDLEFEKTLALRHGKKEYEQCGISSNDDKPEFMKRIHPQSTLAKHFTCTPFNDKVEYFYNSAKDKKAFEYHKDPAKVLFNDISRKSAKAGLQRLVADTKAPSTLTVFGAKEFRRNAWIEAQLMGLEAKGIKLEGYTPTPADLELVKKTQEQYASMNKKPEPKPEAPTVAVEPPKAVAPMDFTPPAPTPLESAPAKPEKEDPHEPIKQKQVEQEDVWQNNDHEFEMDYAEPIYSNNDHEFESEKPHESHDDLIDSLQDEFSNEPLKVINPEDNNLPTHENYEDLQPEPATQKVEGDYSTYELDELCDEIEDIINSLDRRCFIGNSSNDIDGHRYWDSTHKDYVNQKPANERKQYHLRQDLYEVFDEIEHRDSSLAHEINNEFKKSMKYKSAFKPDIQYDRK